MKLKDIRSLLHVTGEEQKELFREADIVRKKILGDTVYFRGIIEFSNYCEKNCYYCGIRRGNMNVQRYKMTFVEVQECLAFIHASRYGSVVLQSGEGTTEKSKEYILDIVQFIAKTYPNMGITLSLGELDRDFLRTLRDAGAHRYLLRIETSVPELYSQWHPKDHLWEKRRECLQDLRELNYQVGCGNMIGVPGQTDEHLLADLEFFQKMDFDMFGLGPYVIHEDTPFGEQKGKPWWQKQKKEILSTTLNFIALLRILMPTANIAAATALEAIHSYGRIMALQAGANIFMPSVTPKEYRTRYLLYQNKPCVDEDAGNCSGCSVAKVRRAGLTPLLGEQGNSKHYTDRNM
jgi:biotin synthase